MRHEYAELIGIAAAAASLYAAHARTMIPLRIAAIVANALAMSYSFLHGTYPTFALNAILLPINAWRLRAMLNLIRNINEATKSDMNVDWRIVARLQENGHDATHLRDQGLQRMADVNIFAKAHEEGRIVVTFDLDFGEIAAATAGSWVSARARCTRPGWSGWSTRRRRRTRRWCSSARASPSTPAGSR